MSRFFAQRKKSGFTVVEVLVYLAIFVTVVAASSYLLFSLNDVIHRYKVHTVLYRSGSNALEQVEVELRRANLYNSAGSVVNASSTGALSLTNGATTTTFTKVGDELRLTINGVSYGNLLHESVVAQGFTVYQYPTAVGTLVRVKLELSATIGSTTKDVDLYTGAVVRGDL